MLSDEKIQLLNNYTCVMINLVEIYSNARNRMISVEKKYFAFQDIIRSLSSVRGILTDIILKFDYTSQLINVLQKETKLDNTKETCRNIFMELNMFTRLQKELVSQTEILKITYKSNNLWNNVAEEELMKFLHYVEEMNVYTTKLQEVTQSLLREFEYIENSVCGMMSIGSIDDIITTDD